MERLAYKLQAPGGPLELKAPMPHSRRQSLSKAAVHKAKAKIAQQYAKRLKKSDLKACQVGTKPAGMRACLEKKLHKKKKASHPAQGAAPTPAEPAAVRRSWHDKVRHGARALGHRLGSLGHRVRSLLHQ